MITDETFLGPLGISAIEERIYRHLLTSPGESPTQIARALGMGTTEVRGAIKSLRANGLLTKAVGAREGLVPLGPQLVVESLLARRQEELEQARQSTPLLLEEFEAGAHPREPGQLITLVEGKDALNLHCLQLQQTAKSEILSFVMGPRSPDEDYPTEYTNVDVLQRLSEGVSVRVIYERAAVEAPGHLTTIQRYVDAGEEARVCTQLPTWMLITDRKLGLIPLDRPQFANGGAALLNPSWLLDALLMLFEKIWNESLPISTATGIAASGVSSPVLEDKDRHILAGLMAGVKDETIARQLHLNPVTIRRRIARILKELNAETRFQAGVQAAKRGWV